MMLVVRVLSRSAHPLTNEAGIGSKSHFLVVEDKRIGGDGD